MNSIVKLLYEKNSIYQIGIFLVPSILIHGDNKLYSFFKNQYEEIDIEKRKYNLIIKIFFPNI